MISSLSGVSSIILVIVHFKNRDILMNKPLHTFSGYERAEVTRALSISGNNLRMARDILREFGRRK